MPEKTTRTLEPTALTIGVSVERLSLSSAALMSVVNDLVDGVLESISPDGDLNPNTSSIGLLELRRLAEKARRI